jgi:hypothetical protein
MSEPVVVDLTAAPYHCDPMGLRDCTQALRRAFDDALRADRDDVLATKARMAAPGAVAESPQTHPGKVTLTRNSPPATILHLPAGTYRVSGTIGYTWGDHINDPNHDHFARMIHLRGAGRDATRIRLDDRCPGFAGDDGRAVIEILRGLKTAVAMQNSIESLAVDTGSGNPGAVGIDFYCNNTGALRDVAVRSGDGQGVAGIAIRKWNSSCALIQRVEVAGFGIGVQILHHRLYTVLEDVTVHGQSRTGILVDGHNVAIHRVISRNRVPALTIVGATAHVVAVDIDAAGGDGDAAVDVRAGIAFVRDLRCAGYARAIDHAEGFALAGPRVADWCSHPTWRLFRDQPGGSLRLPIRDAPVPRSGLAPSDWTDVAAFGAVGDGRHDDTEAIRAAFAAGGCIRFGRGRFRLSGQVRVAATVQRVDFQYADLEADPRLAALDDAGAFLVDGGDEPLFVERLFTNTGFMGRHRLIVQEGVRTLILRDLHTQVTNLYRNRAPGSDVFIENCACTGEGAEHLPGFHFIGQRVWARQINPERSHVQVINDGGDLWVLGFKTENPSTAFLTRNGGRTEVLGGIFNQVRQYHPDGAARPTIINDESSVSVSASTTDWRINRSFEGKAHVMVREIRGGEVRDLVWEALPLRMPHLAAIPLYTGRPEA